MIQGSVSATPFPELIAPRQTPSVGVRRLKFWGGMG